MPWVGQVVEMGRLGPTVAFKTLGCRVNQSDSDVMLRGLIERGFYPVEFGQAADVVVINTCTVTHVADRKSRNAIARGMRENPEGVLAVTGCYAAIEPQKLQELFPRARIFSPADQSRLLEEVSRAVNVPSLESPRSSETQPSRQNRVRPMVKVQEGCDHICAFCIIPRARGRSRSRSVSAVKAEVVRLMEMGVNEVVLAGVSIGSYRCPETRIRLGQLISELAAEVEGMRIRLSSVEPIDFDEDIFGLLADKVICPHLHIPIQSGSDNTLLRMRRQYTVSNYERLVALAREANPDVAIATDVLVGFPGESSNDFCRSLEFISRTQFAYLHVFPYSTRPRTVASHMTGNIDPPAKRVRVQRMIDLGERMKENYARRFLGRSRTVLWEHIVDGVGIGVTDNFLKVTGPAVTATVGSLETIMLAPGGLENLTAISQTS